MTTAQPTTATADSLRTILTDTFGDVELTGLELHDRPCFIAREIGEALGYANSGKRFASSITGRWSSDMVEGKHYAILSQQQLHALVQLKGSTPGTFPNRGLIVLFEAGLNIALLRTSMSAGVRLRAWLAERAMPALARGHAVDAHGEVLEGSHARPQPALDTNDLRQRRLALAEARRSLGRIERDGAITPQQRGQALLGAFRSTMRGVLSDAMLDALGAPPAPPLAGPNLPRRIAADAVMLPEEAAVVDRSWLAPEQIAARLEMQGTRRELQARIGRAISGVGRENYTDGKGEPDRDGLRKDRSLAKPAVVNKQGAGDSIQIAADTGLPDTTEGFVYHPRKVPPMLRAWLRENRPGWLPARPGNLSTVRVDPEQQGQSSAELGQSSPQSSSSAGGASC